MVDFLFEYSGLPIAQPNHWVVPDHTGRR